MGNTTRVRAKNSGSWQTATIVYGKHGGTWKPARYVYAKRDGVWQGVYSVLSGSKSDGFLGQSGASGSGTVDCTASADASGYIGAKSYSWTKTSGADHTCLNPTSQTPTWRYSFSSVGPEQTAYAYSTWECTITDQDTGATVVVGGVSIGSAWTNITPAYSGSTNKLTSGSGSVTAPAGANSVTIYCIAIGGQGGSGYNDGLDHQYGGGGGGGGGRVVWSGAVTGGVTSFSYSVGNFGSNTTAGGLTAAPGVNGGSADGGGPGGGGSGGGASGGNVANDTGGDGTSALGSSQGFGGAGHGAPDGTYGYGGDGSDGFGSGGSSPGGAVVFFVWSP